MYNSILKTPHDHTPVLQLYVLVFGFFRGRCIHWVLSSVLRIYECAPGGHGCNGPHQTRDDSQFHTS
jgi:hypothetical protein